MTLWRFSTFLLGPYLYQIEEVIRIVDQLSRRHEPDQG